MAIVGEEVKDSIRRMRDDGNSANDIAIRYGIGVSTVYSWMRKLGIKHCYRKKNVNLLEDYFETIDTNEKAYWLGWLITDGCIYDTCISISLQARDKHILEEFEKDLHLTDCIKPFNGKYYRFEFWSKKMVNDLAKYGIVRNKTFTVDLPKLDDDLMPSLLRGCLDGDGSVMTSNGTFKHFEVSFTRKQAMCNFFFKRVIQDC